MTGPGGSASAVRPSRGAGGSGPGRPMDSAQSPSTRSARPGSRSWSDRAGGPPTRIRGRAARGEPQGPPGAGRRGRPQSRPGGSAGSACAPRRGRMMSEVRPWVLRARSACGPGRSLCARSGGRRPRAGPPPAVAGRDPDRMALHGPFKPPRSRTGGRPKVTGATGPCFESAGTAGLRVDPAIRWIRCIGSGPSAGPGGLCVALLSGGRGGGGVKGGGNTAEQNNIYSYQGGHSSRGGAVSPESRGSPRCSQDAARIQSLDSRALPTFQWHYTHSLLLHLYQYVQGTTAEHTECASGGGRERAAAAMGRQAFSGLLAHRGDDARARFAAPRRRRAGRPHSSRKCGRDGPGLTGECGSGETNCCSPRYVSRRRSSAVIQRSRS